MRKRCEVFMEVFTDASIEAELQEYFSFFVPGYRFMPKYKSKMWDGKIRLYNRLTKQIYIGLYPKVKQFCKERGYDLSEDNQIQDIQSQATTTFIEEFLETLKLPFQAREYQIKAITHAVKNNRTVLLSPTGSGKSLMIYALTRFYGLKTLIIVPTIGLVNQMKDDFENYSVNDPSFDADQSIHLVHGGTTKGSTKDIVISTWQSIYKQKPDYFEQYDVVFGDEVHLFKAKSLTSILEKLSKAAFRFGTTGTLDGSLTHKLVLEGLFGSVHKVTTTKNLMEDKHLAELDINCLILDYEESVCKENKGLKFQEEMKFLISHPQRNLFIRNLSCKLKGNTLVLFQYVEKHGKILHKIIESKAKKDDPDRKIFYVSGETDGETRENVRKIVEKEDNAIIVASVGVFSTGVNIKNLENIIFASPSKSRIRTLQSIGRTLRVGRSDKARLFDICDDLSYKSHKNFTLKHFMERVKIYNDEKFNYKIKKVKMKTKEK